nr:RNA helicase ATP-dependent, SK12/DOB1 protein [Cryptomonas sp.]
MSRFANWPKTYILKRKKNNELKHLFTISSSIDFYKKVMFNKTIFVEKEMPVKKFPYKLDCFQKISIRCIVNSENVMVAAHTSSGKTAIAEYAIANSLYIGQSVIYTSPIKALSNQKFRDLSRIFSKVGLITGDISINSSANCVVMTTEILRSLLYEKLHSKSRLKWVILDETHYIRDRERGYIWEEIFMLLPHSVKLICLSATIPNAREIAEWIADIKNTSINTIETSKRPVILQHYIYPYCNPGLFLVTDKKGLFLTKKYWDIFSKCNLKIKKSCKISNLNNNIKKIIQKIYKIGHGPVIIFSFGKKKCFQLINELKYKNFCNKKETEIIQLFLDKCFSSISKKYKEFLRIDYIFYIVKKGIGIHHSGIFPLIREITEILFQATLVKILFATETFSIGLNMPAKTVIFSNLDKFDGQNVRILSKSEFIQMSGRAGRRGIDDKGIVITTINKNANLKKIEDLIKGKVEPVISMFHINVNSVLKNIRNKRINEKYFSSQSFFTYQNLLFKIKKTKAFKQFKRMNKLLISPFVVLAEYIFDVYKLFKKIKIYLRKFYSFSNKIHMNRRQKIKHIIKSFPINGRNLWTIFPIFLKIEQLINTNSKTKILSNNQMTLRILLIIFLFSNQFRCDLIETSQNSTFSLQKVSILIFRLSVQIYLIFIRKKIKNIVYNPDILLSIVKKKNHLEIYELKYEKLCCKNQILFQKQLKELKKALTSLKIIHITHFLTFKGLICSELNFEEDILLTELIFLGKLSNLSADKLAALVSIFITQEVNKKTKSHPDLKYHINAFQLIFEKMKIICENCILHINVMKYIGEINMTIPNIIYGLCKGSRFSEIFKADILIEGNFNKDIKKLCDLFVQLSRVCEKLGDINLSVKFDNCFSKIEKCSVFMKSFYF